MPTDQEMKAIYAAADRIGRANDYMENIWARYRPLIYLAGFSGMRPSEIRGLHWSSIFDGRVIVRQRADKTGRIGPVKSRAGRRTIYLPKRVTDMLFEWKKRCPKSSLDLVFPTESGKPMALVNFVAGAWFPLMKEAGLIDRVAKGSKTVEKARYSPYALRHYYASKLIEKGRDFKSIQTALGHSRIEITFNTYGHLIRGNEEAHREAAENLISDLLDQ